MRRIEHRGAVETAHRALQNCGQVFRYAVATGRAERDPSGDLRGALPPVATRHHASITDTKAIGQSVKGLKIGVVREEQLNLFWRNYVHQELGDSEAGRRRRYLVEDLGGEKDGVARGKLIDISVRVYKHYLGRGEKTI